jgi:EmrB/QacA subfamily drug resistance transporter
MRAETLSADAESRLALLVCLAAGFMTLLDVSIVNVALPSMERGLTMSPVEVSWAVAGYALTFGLTLIPAGRLGDEYGRRKLFLIGLSLFAVTAIICGAAPDATILVVGRLCRGVAAGLLAPQVIGLMQQMYSGLRRGKAFGYYGATVGLSTAVGPLLGGVSLRAFGATEGWRFVFYLSVPVVLGALAVGFRVLPADQPDRVRHRMDLMGALLLGFGVLALMFPLLQETGAKAHPRFWLFAVGAACLALFVLWERHLGARGGDPLVSLKLLSVRSYSIGAVTAFLFYAGFTSIFLVITMFLQQGLKYSPLQAALSTLIFTVASAGSAVVSGRVVHRVGRRIVVLGSGLATLGLAAVALFAYSWTGPDTGLVLALPLLVAGCGCGLVISANQTLTLHEITRANAGVAAGVYETGQRIGTALGTALASALFFGGLAGTGGDFHVAVGLGLTSPAVLVGVAFLIGFVDIGSSHGRSEVRHEAGASAMRSSSGTRSRRSDEHRPSRHSPTETRGLAGDAGVKLADERHT